MSNVVRTNGDQPNNATSDTTFGRSVESQAQMADAARTASPTVGSDEPLNIYHLAAAAPLDDPRWGNAPYQGDVWVAARTAGDARIVAASRELDFMEVDAAPAEDVTTSNASAFRSELLYSVTEVERGRRDLQRGVLEGDISVATIRSVED